MTTAEIAKRDETETQSAALVRAAVAQLPGKWTIDERYHWAMTATNTEGTAPRLELIFSFGQYGTQLGRVECRSCAPTRDGASCSFQGWGASRAPAPSTSFANTRTAAAVAKQIAAKIIGPTRPMMATIAERQAEDRERDAARVDLCARIQAQTGRAPFGHSGDRGAQHFRFGGNGNAWGDLTVQTYARADATFHSLTADQAESLAKWAAANLGQSNR